MLRLVVLLYFTLATSCKTLPQNSALLSDEEIAAQLDQAVRELFQPLTRQMKEAMYKALQASLAMNETEFKAYMDSEEVRRNLQETMRLQIYQALLSLPEAERRRYMHSPYFLVNSYLGSVSVKITTADGKITASRADSGAMDWVGHTAKEADAAVEWARKYLLPNYSKEQWTAAFVRARLPDDKLYSFLSEFESSYSEYDGSSESGLINLVKSKVDVSALISKEVFTRTLNELSQTKQAIYDNNQGIVLLKDKQAILASSLFAYTLLNSSHQKIKQYTAKLPQDLRVQLAKDTNSLDPASRTELIDLIRSSLKVNLSERIYSDLTGWEQVSSRRISTMVEQALELLGLKNREQQSPSNIYVLRGSDESEKKFMVACMGREFTHNSSSHTQEKVGDYFIVSTFDYQNGSPPPPVIELNCDEQSYKITTSVTSKLATLPKPVFNIKELYRDNNLQASTSVSLVSEINLDAIIAGVAYLSARGFLPYGYTWVQDMKQEFAHEFVNNVDIFIPASHIHQVLGLGVGVKNALRIDFIKYASGLKIGLTVYFPPFKDDHSQALQIGPRLWQATLATVISQLKANRPQKLSTEIVHLQPAELSQLFCERRNKKRSRAVILTVACGASAYLNDWMSAYRASHFDQLGNLKPINEVDDVPVVIAPSRGFNTNSSAEILAHLEYPLTLIESIARGDSIEKALALLNSDAPKSWLQSTIKRVARDDSSDTFEGVANTSHDHLFNLGEKLNIKVSRVN